MHATHTNNHTLVYTSISIMSTIITIVLMK